MFSLLQRLPEREISTVLIALAAILAVTLVVMTFLLVRFIARHHQRQVAVPVMQELLNRGMSPGEIQEFFATAWNDSPAGISRWTHVPSPGSR